MLRVFIILTFIPNDVLSSHCPTDGGITIGHHTDMEI